jgi:hypothetical protein
MKEYRIIKISNGKEYVYYVEKRKRILWIFSVWNTISAETHSVLASAEIEIRRHSKDGFTREKVMDLKA